MSFNPDDFLSGKYDEYFTVFNQYYDTANQYTPIRPSTVNQRLYEYISRTIPQFPYLISSWQSNVGANNSTVTVDTATANTDSVKRRKELVKSKVYNTIYKDQNWKLIELEAIKKLAIEGSCVLMFNKDGKLIVESIFRFNVYWDRENKIARYAYLANGTEVTGMTDLKHGVDLWHLKDPIFAEYPVPPSRIETALSFILLEQKAVKMNTSQFAKGWINTILLKISAKEVPQITDKTEDKNGKTWFQRLMDRLNDQFSGTEKAGRVGSIPGLEDVFRLGNTNKDSQFYELIKELTPERIAWAYSMTLTDFGAGGATTYNNVGSFDDALYDKFGRPVENLLDMARNEWVLPYLGIQTSGSLFIKYNEPEDSNKLLEVAAWLQDWINDTMTLNEYREVRGLSPLPDGDKTFSELQAIKNPAPQPIIQGQDPNATATDVKSKPKDQKQKDNAIQPFFTKAVEFAQKTPIQKALESKEYETVKSRWSKAITSQVKDFLTKFQNVKDSNLGTYKVKLSKIESYYDFKTCKNDLLKFAKMAIDEVKADKRTSFSLKKDFLGGEYPQVVLDNVDRFTEALLKGNDMFDSVDDETTSQIQNIIKNNITKGIQQISNIIQDEIPDFSNERADLIAGTAVADTVEATRGRLYSTEFPDGSKEWMTAVNDVCSICISNQDQGQIRIGEEFNSGDEYPTAHNRCKCTTLYFPAD